MGQEWLGPSYFFISLVLGPLNSLLEESTDPNRYTAKAKFCFCKNNKRMIICCRENELNGTFKNSKGSADYDAKGFGKSLRSTSRNAEFVVGSACDPGTLALPNAGARNSRYTEALLRHLPVAGRKLEESMKEAGKDVFEATHKKQRPWVNGCLMHDVVLVAKK